jgi:hypothetical protein
VIGGKAKLAALVIALSSGAVTLVSAQEQSAEPAVERKISVYGLADALIKESQPEAACALIEQVYGLDTEDVGALRRLGTCMLAMGRAHESLALLERAKKLLPDDADLLAQVEISEAVVALAELMLAMEEVQPIEAASPNIVAQQVQRIPAVPPTQTAQPVEVVDVVAEPPLPGPMPSGRVVVPLDWENAIAVDAGLAGSLQDHEHDESRLDLFLSSAWITGTNVTGGQVRAHTDLSWVAGLYEGLSIGLEGSAHHMISDSTTLIGSVDVAHRFRAFADDAGWAVNGKVGVRHVLSPEVQIGANVLGERLAVSSAARSYWRTGAELYVNAARTDTLGLNLNAGVDLVGFDGSIALFTDQRSDVRWRAGGSLNWSLAEIAPGLSTQASYSFSHQQSNQDLYDTNRHLANVSLSYAF